MAIATFAASPPSLSLPTLTSLLPLFYRPLLLSNVKAINFGSSTRCARFTILRRINACAHKVPHQHQRTRRRPIPPQQCGLHLALALVAVLSQRALRLLRLRRMLVKWVSPTLPPLPPPLRYCTHSSCALMRCVFACGMAFCTAITTAARAPSSTRLVLLSTGTVQPRAFTSFKNT